jgi:antirestriction protein
MKTTVDTPKIYVGTYAKYNSGSIEGEWLDLTDYSSYDEFMEACRELHKDEEDPELMFQDYENIPECFVDESWISENYWEYLEALEELGDKREAFEVFVNHMGYDLNKEDISSLVSDFEDAYQ